jgi:hypothetical protein
MSVLVIGLGALYMALARSHDHGVAPYGDAIPPVSTTASEPARRVTTSEHAGEIDVH